MAIRSSTAAKPVASLAGVSRWVLIALVAASILLRVGYYLELSRGPCLWAHRISESDMNFFDRWARAIAGGDWLTDQELHPLFQWERLVAQSYFRQHPDQVAAFERAGMPRGDQAALDQALWNRWFQGKEFHQEPLYPYLVALTYSVFGPDVRWVFAWQMAFGVLTNVLIYLLARRYFGEVAGAIAALLVLFYSPLFFYELTLLRTTLTAFLAVALVAAADRALRLGSTRAWLLFGIASGIAMLCQTVFAIFALGCLGLLVARRWRQWPALARSAGALVAGSLLALSPALARNLAVGVAPLRFCGVSGETFVLYNAAPYNPDIGAAMLTGPQVEVMGKAEGRLLPSIAASVQTHGAADYLRLLWRKFANLWYWYEAPDNQNFYYYRLFSFVLRAAPFTNTFMAPLLLMGLLVAAPRFRDCVPLYLMALTGIAVVLVTAPLSRFRVQFFAAMIPFAAYLIAEAVRWARGRRYAELAALLAALAGAFLWTAHPLPAARPLIRFADYATPYSYYWGDLEVAAVERRDWRRAAAVLQESFRYEPEVVRSLGPNRPCRSVEEVQLAAWYGRMHSILAVALQQSGDQAGYAREMRRVSDLQAATRPK